VARLQVSLVTPSNLESASRTHTHTHTPPLWVAHPCQPANNAALCGPPVSRCRQLVEAQAAQQMEVLLSFLFDSTALQQGCRQDWLAAYDKEVRGRLCKVGGVSCGACHGCMFGTGGLTRPHPPFLLPLLLLPLLPLLLLPLLQFVDSTIAGLLSWAPDAQVLLGDLRQRVFFTQRKQVCSASLRLDANEEGLVPAERPPSPQTHRPVTTPAQTAARQAGQPRCRSPSTSRSRGPSPCCSQSRCRVRPGPSRHPSPIVVQPRCVSWPNSGSPQSAAVQCWPEMSRLRPLARRLYALSP
jgi:hypothetical protein